MQVVARKFTHVEFQSYLDRTEPPRAIRIPLARVAPRERAASRVVPG